MAVSDCQASTARGVGPCLAFVDFIYNTCLLLFDKMSRDQGERHNNWRPVDACSLVSGGSNQAWAETIM